MFSYLIVSVLVSTLYTTAALECYRCFGSEWCNNSTDPRFLSNVHQIDCPTTNTAYNYDGNSPLMKNILKYLQKKSIRSNDIEILNNSQWGCVTATLHEASEAHTVRTCLNSALAICPTIRNVVLNSTLNDISPDISLDCEGCTDNLCNNQIFVESEQEESSSTAGASSPSTSPEPSLSTTPSSPVSEESSQTTPLTTSSPPSSGPETSSPSGPSTNPENSSDPTSPSSPTIAPETTEKQDETTHPDSGQTLIVPYLVLITAIAADFIFN